MAKYNVGEVIFRHGDLLLKKTDRPIRKDGGPTVAQAVLLAGQNHNHTLTGEFRVYEDGGKRYLEVLKTSMFDHDEHGKLQIKKRPTALELRQQVEYDHFLEESRAVID